MAITERRRRVETSTAARTTVPVTATIGAGTRRGQRPADGAVDLGCPCRRRLLAGQYRPRGNRPHFHRNRRGPRLLSGERGGGSRRGRTAVERHPRGGAQNQAGCGLGGLHLSRGGGARRTDPGNGQTGRQLRSAGPFDAAGDGVGRGTGPGLGDHPRDRRPEDCRGWRVAGGVFPGAGFVFSDGGSVFPRDRGITFGERHYPRAVLRYLRPRPGRPRAGPTPPDTAQRAGGMSVRVRLQRPGGCQHRRSRRF